MQFNDFFFQIIFKSDFLTTLLKKSFNSYFIEFPGLDNKISS